MPAETWAARASASFMSSLAERLFHRAAVEMQNAEPFARRAQEDAQDGRHGSLGDAAGAEQLRVLIDAGAQDRLPLGEAAMGQALAEGGAAGDLFVAGVEGAQAQGSVRAVGQHDGAALGLQRGDGVAQDRVQELFFAFQVDQMMAGAEQGLKLIAGPRRLLRARRRS